MICTLQYLGEGVLMFAVDLEMHQKARQLESPLLPPEVQMDPLAVTPSAGSCIPPAPHLPPPHFPGRGNGGAGARGSERRAEAGLPSQAKRTLSTFSANVSGLPQPKTPSRPRMTFPDLASGPLQSGGDQGQSTGLGGGPAMPPAWRPGLRLPSV